MIKLGELDEHIGFHLRLAQDISFRAYARQVGAPHLKPGRFSAMVVIKNNPGISQIALGRAISRDKSTITPMVRELVNLGVVLRAPSATDRRSMTLTLTSAGESMLDDLARAAEAHDRRLDEVVGDQKGVLIELLKRIEDALV